MSRILALAVLAGIFLFAGLGCSDNRVSSTPNQTIQLPKDGPVPGGAVGPGAPGKQKPNRPAASAD